MSPSNTTKNKLTADTPIQYLKGVGPRIAALFESRGIFTIKDLLYFFPRSYEDRTKVSTVLELQEGLKSTFSVEVLSSRKIPTRVRGKSIFEVTAQDSSGKPISLKWFYLPKGYDLKFTPGIKVLVTGTPKIYMGRPQLVHPEITWGKTIADLNESKGSENDPLHVGRVIPVYSEIEGLTSRALRKLIWDTLHALQNDLKDDLPEIFRIKYQFPPLIQSLKAIHFPNPDEKKEEAIQSLLDYRTPHHTRLIFEEFFKFELLVLRKRLLVEKEHAPTFKNNASEDFKKYLPFELTNDQQSAVNDILSDLSKPFPMSRLIQGDVGSGKTAVAFLAAVTVLSDGHQVALMAPTEILAEQHFRNAEKFFGSKIRIALLTGKTSAKERKELFERLEKGEPLFLFGTHALIEDPVKFKSLSLVMIDEQHRFGVEQRKKLKEKGIHFNQDLQQNVHAHFLVLTATPIPRTLALTVYGDLSVSLIKQMPPGRSSIITRVQKGTGREKLYQFIKKEIDKGRQAYFIFPLIQESEAEGFQSLQNAIESAESLQQEIFPEFKVGLLHGKMKSTEKEDVMMKFKKGEFHILVSTTVVEVGVDVPNATVMVIENSERFGLSQLHQLRGRVGRGQFQSYCFLTTHAKVSETTTARLLVLEQSTDGFKIAEEDLKIRGPGEFLGTRQSGSLPFHIADLVRDQEILFKARDEAIELLKIDPDLKRDEHKSLSQFINEEGKKQFSLLKTS